jgi:capsular exopolysaccharide synthesis family protein
VTFKRRSKQTAQLVTIQNEKVGSEFQESVRRLRMKLLRETQQEKAQILMVTSTLPGEGKTTVACNLALSLSQNGARVILVDLDLRKPSVKKNLGVSAPSRGVGYLLAKEGMPRNCLVPVEGSTLQLLADDKAAGSLRKKSLVRKLSVILEGLRQEADYIILDTPPSGLLADSGTVAHLADGTIYVVRAGVAQASHILDSLQFLGESGTNILGCVLNGSSGSHGGYGYYGYGYRYGYGSYGGYGKSKKRKPAMVPAEPEDDAL